MFRDVGFQGSWIPDFVDFCEVESLVLWLWFLDFTILGDSSVLGTLVPRVFEILGSWNLWS